MMLRDTRNPIAVWVELLTPYRPVAIRTESLPFLRRREKGHHQNRPYVGKDDKGNNDSWNPRGRQARPLEGLGVGVHMGPLC